MSDDCPHPIPPLSKRSKRMNHFIEGIAIAVTLLAVLMMGGTITVLAGWLDGKVNPVIRDFAVEAWVIEPEQGESGILTGSFYKERDCDYEGLRIYASDRIEGDQDDRLVERLFWTLYDQPPRTVESRPTGQHDFGPWEISAPSSRRLRYIHIEVQHVCYGVFSRQQELVVLEWPPN